MPGSCSVITLRKKADMLFLREAGLCDTLSSFLVYRLCGELGIAPMPGVIIYGSLLMQGGAIGLFGGRQ
jgi:hypothetical protein